MSDYTVYKCMWVAQPRRKDGYKSHWSVTPVKDCNSTRPGVLSPPDKGLGYAHEPYKLYYSADELMKLVSLLERWATAASGHGESVPMSEILATIEKYKPYGEKNNG